MSGFSLGILDWGIGGLGTYHALRARFPEASILYWSDAGAVPYGKLPRAALAARVQAVLRELTRRGARQLVVACNAASTVLRDVRPDAPCLGVIDSALAAVPPRLRGTLGVLGGARTIRAGVYQRALGRPGLRVVGRIAQPLSALIEAGASDAAFSAAAAPIVAPLRNADLVLWACTHYPARADAFRRLAPGVRFLDPAEALVEDIARRFTLDRDGRHQIVTTSDPGAMRRAARLAWGLSLPPVRHVAFDPR